MANSIQNKLLCSGILESLKQNNKSYAKVSESKSLIAVYEQQIFVWHDAAFLLTMELKTTGETNDFKMLMLTNPPLFEVDSLQFNNTGSLISLFGKNGVMIFEVPWRYGKFGCTSENKRTLLGRSWNVAEQFFVCSNRINVVQVAWHPGSSSSTHLTVLSSDNYIRIYDVTDPQSPLQVICLGLDSKSSYLSSDSKISFSTLYGENAVSFDFGPPENIYLPQSDKKNEIVDQKQMIWPIYLLHGNGDVYVIKAPMKKERYHPGIRIDEPLAMYPPSEDNYGFESCSILCLPSSPPCLVIATAKNMLYHCLILETTSEAAGSCGKAPKSSSTWSFDSVCEQPETSLYVFESVELPVSVSDDDQNDVYSHPIKFYKDTTSTSKYHCTQLSGVHSVAVPFLKAIEDSLEKDNISNWLSQHQDEQCVVEHVLCTKPFQETDAIPVLGFDVTVCDAGVIMICLLASWDFLCLPLVSSYHSLAPSLLSQDAISRHKRSSGGDNFEQHIDSALNRSMCSPFLRTSQALDSNKTSPQQWLDLLLNVTQRFREDYVQRLTTAHAHLESRVKILVKHKEQQLKDINRCHTEEQTLRSGAERLAEKFEDAMSAQQLLMERLEKVLQGLQRNLPDLSEAELTMKKNLSSYQDNLKSFQTSLDQIKKKIKHQKEKTAKAQAQNEVNDTMQQLSHMNLGETQLKHVKELLTQEGESITQLVQTVTSLKKESGL